MNNDDTQNGTRERAQVGIGTLIVFIAMVLVAAIAAGVLINTAGFLQTQAEDTGTESTEQVADAINVITEVGEVGNNDEIHNVRVGVQPAAGADEINLAELTVQYVSDENFTNLVVAQDESQGQMEPGDNDFTDKRASGDTAPSNVNPQAWTDSDGQNPQSDQRYGIDVITAENEDDLVMTENSDRYEIVINTSGLTWADTDDIASSGEGRFIGPLNEGVDVELTVTNEVGSQTVAFMSVPDTLSDQEDGDTVNL